MSFILLFGIGMAFLSGIFWIMEVIPYVRYVKRLKIDKRTSVLHNTVEYTKYNFKLVKGSLLLLPFIFDLAVTMALSSIFSFGGMVGGIIGLFISNILSIFIIIVKNIEVAEEV